MNFSNQKGQSLIEYLIVVGLMAVASVGVMSALGKNVQAQFARAALVLGGDRNPKQIRTTKPKKDHYKYKDFSNFVDGAVIENQQD